VQSVAKKTFARGLFLFVSQYFIDRQFSGIAGGHNAGKDWKDDDNTQPEQDTNRRKVQGHGRTHHGFSHNGEQEGTDREG